MRTQEEMSIGNYCQEMNPIIRRARLLKDLRRMDIETIRMHPYFKRLKLTLIAISFTCALTG